MLLVRREPLDRIEHTRLGAGVAGDGLGQPGRREPLEEDGADVLAADELDQALQPLRARLGLRIDSGDRDLVQVVARGQVPERGVAGDEIAPRAVR